MGRRPGRGAPSPVSSGRRYTHLFFRGRRVTEQGFVTKLRSNGLIVIVPRYGIESVVMLGRRRATATPAEASGGSMMDVAAEKDVGEEEEGREGAAGSPRRAIVADGDDAVELNTEEQVLTVRGAAPDGGDVQLRVFDEVRVGIEVEARGAMGVEERLHVELLEVIPRGASRAGAARTAAAARPGRKGEEEEKEVLGRPAAKKQRVAEPMEVEAAPETSGRTPAKRRKRGGRRA